jgi:GntR family transcriptional regulator/MocR family aminotransferase
LKHAAQVYFPPLSLDRDRPLPQQIRDALRTAIQSGRLSPNDRLPATRAFARLLGVSRQVVVSAYEELITTGHVRGRVGAGTYVAWMEPPLWVCGSRRLISDPDDFVIHIWAEPRRLLMLPRNS